MPTTAPVRAAASASCEANYYEAAGEGGAACRCEAGCGFVVTDSCAEPPPDLEEAAPVDPREAFPRSAESPETVDVAATAVCRCSSASGPVFKGSTLVCADTARESLLPLPQ